MQLVRINSATLIDSVKAGIAAGQAAAWAIFGLILAVDATLVTPPGTFYKMIGMALGQGPSADVYLGFLMHMITATVIGIIYMIISNSVKKLYIRSVPKGLATGVITGIVVWAILFLPLNFGLVQPMLQGIVAQGPQAPMFQLAEKLLTLSTTILAGSLALHIVFGGVLGFIGRIATSSGEILGEQEQEQGR
ncbi:hypothetical protein NTE_00427 [Candidatus Nitrososphaera evergladensis SR1]|jgi:hypothetical protein|uniref:Uncharacterized protein n=1 Tax=Candidatus Nitrososphaera evergladensis SR1 TaxID=1459636 RepID=A0A075MT63_9ARCH|nr:hypothetical protein [Candidatus Nitrososphaera evergladensis]AIF82509.1 hypothetical protein NTE_00427 [Candidatus Nitrososphaera evergladensis SR1]